MDIAMPGIDGFETFRQISESDTSAKVIFITAHEVNEYARQALLAGAFSMLSKPVEPEDMIALVVSLLGFTEEAASSRNETRDVIRP